MSAKAAIWPFLGILFIGAAALVIAGTVVLALIPIYIRNSAVAGSSTSAKDLDFYVQYSSDLDDDDDTTGGDISNTAEVAKSLGVSDQIQILSAQSQASFSRRRRDASQHRSKRGLKMNILLRCAPLATLSCFTSSCLASTRNRAILVMQQASNLTGIGFNITTDGVVRRLKLSLVFLGTVLSKPSVGFNEVKSLTFVAVQSGSFVNSSTWTNGTIPYGNCSIIIPAGINVTLNRPIFELRMRQCDIFGTLIVGGGNRNFRFNFPSAITVYNGGNLIDASTDKQLYIPSNSLLMVFPNASIGSSGTTLQLISRSGSVVQQLGSSVSIPSKGPHTCGILRSGAIISESKIVYIAVGGGSILRGSTFLGGVGPTAALCEIAGGCSLNIQPGATVETADLDDDFNINFNVISIKSGGKFFLGKPGSNKGIKFRYSFQMDCMGILNFVGAAGNILLAVGSQWSFLAGGSFSAAFAVLMQTYNSATGAILSVISLGSSFLGPLIYVISSTGTIAVTQGMTTPVPTGSGGLG